MKQDRLFLTAGFMPAVVMAALLLLEQLLSGGFLPQNIWVILAAELAAYLIPVLILRFLPDGQGKRAKFRFKSYRRQTIALVLWMSLAAALVAAAANYGMAVLLHNTAFSGSVTVTQYGIQDLWQTLLAVVVVPAVVEELFFRGVLFNAFERCGTWPALLLSAVAFAMIHGNPANFAGPLIAGLIYGYLTYVLDSVWPAIFAHMINNALALFLSNTAETYLALGLWPYIMLAGVFCLCMFTALAMRALDKQIEKSRVRRLQSKNRSETLTAVLVSPGIWLTMLLFLVRILY